MAKLLRPTALLISYVLAGCYMHHELGPEPSVDGPPGTSIDESPIDDPVIEVSAGDQHTCALRASGQVICWGRNDHGQLGDGSTQVRESVVATPMSDAIAVSAGGSHSCAIDFAGQVWCWGELRLGADVFAPRDHLLPTRIDGVERAIELADGLRATCAIREDATVHCWGLTPTDGPPLDRPTPLTSPAGIREASLGAFHWCALDDEGSVWCWGENDSGRLGDGSSDASVRPVAVLAVGGATEVSAGGTLSCARAGTEVYCWGLFGDEELGCLSRAHQTATRIAPLGAVAQVSAGGAHACAVAHSGEVFCWGAGGRGQLGMALSACALVLSPTSDRPLRVPVAAATKVSSGAAFSCALLETGEVACWGDNHYGQLGGSAGGFSPVPRLVALSR